MPSLSKEVIPNTIANQPFGYVSWAQTANAKTTGTNYALANLTASIAGLNYTYGLNGKDYSLGFNVIPAYATLTGIEVKFKGLGESDARWKVLLTLNGSSIGTNKNIIPSYLVATNVVLGSSSDLWGIAEDTLLSYLTNVNFGFAIQCFVPVDSSPYLFYMNSYAIKAYWTIPGTIGNVIAGGNIRHRSLRR